MLKRIILLVLTIFTAQSVVLPRKPWTFLTYIAGDNSLASMVDDDIREMRKGANDNVNILVFANIKQNRQKIAKKLIITRNEIILDGSELNLDSGARSTLLKALNWANATAPSEYIAIGLWNHGSGVLNQQYRKRGICFDDTTGHYLNDRDVRADLEEAVKQRGGNKIDVLFLDACLMANLECYATWDEYVKFIVASEQTVPGEGYNYEYVLNSLSRGVVVPKVFASSIVNSYKQNYENIEDDYTLSAISADKIKLLARNVNQLSRNLLELIKVDGSIIKILRDSRNSTIYFQEPSYIDLGHFYANLLANMSKLRLTKKDNKIINELRNLLVNGISLIKQCVINNVTGPYYSSSTGISIYFPPDYIDPSYVKLYWTEKYPKWNELLKRLLR